MKKTLRRRQEKMAASASHSGTAFGTLSGTLLSILGNIQSEDMVKTAVLAVVGALVSFGASLTLKWIWKKVKQ